VDGHDLARILAAQRKGPEPSSAGSSGGVPEPEVDHEKARQAPLRDRAGDTKGSSDEDALEECTPQGRETAPMGSHEGPKVAPLGPARATRPPRPDVEARSRKIADLVLLGLSRQEISAKLSVSKRTVSRAVRRLRAQLREQLAAESASLRENAVSRIQAISRQARMTGRLDVALRAELALVDLLGHEADGTKPEPDGAGVGQAATPGQLGRGLVAQLEEWCSLIELASGSVDLPPGAAEVAARLVAALEARTPTMLETGEPVALLTSAEVECSDSSARTVEVDRSEHEAEAPSAERRVIAERVVERVVLETGRELSAYEQRALERRRMSAGCRVSLRRGW
jgi:DNA-binding CsgD family transcriptional regulator